MELPGFQEYADRYGKKYLGIYHSLRGSILNGRLQDGERLPSSRDLARRYQVSRGTVNIAYEMLLAEGYVTSRVGSGTVVSFPGRPRNRPKPEQAAPDFSRQAERLPRRLRIPAGEWRPGKLNMVVGQPDRRAFPELAWKQAVHHGLRQVDYLQASAGTAHDIFGYPPLREAVAAHLNRRRGLDLAADEICIVNGSIQAIALLTRLLVDPGTPVIMENPGYTGTRDALRAAGGRILALPVDEAGLRLERRKAKLVFVTPSHQFPTGRVLSLERRLALLEFARKHNAMIVEDDYDSEFHHRDRPIEPLKTLDRDGRVIYLGSFSKTMSPALRLGYAALPAGLMEPFALARQIYETVPGALIEQAALAHFMKSGQYDRHLRRMIRLYAAKRERLRGMLEAGLPGAFTWSPSAAGLHLFGWWRHGSKKFVRFTDACRKRGLTWTDPRRFYDGAFEPSVALGFSHLSEHEMERAVKIMKRCF